MSGSEALRDADWVLDCLGLYCPEPLFRTRLEMEELASGAVLEVLADDPSAEADLQRFADQNGHTLLGMVKEEGMLRIYLRKGEVQ